LRRLIVSEMVTVDGFFAGPNGELDWFVQDEALDKFANDLLESVDTILYGRATYQMMAGYWPHARGSFADRTNRLPKLVFSATLDETPWGDWGNARPVKGVLAEEVAKLKNESGNDIVIYGSGSIVQALMRLGAIDEYRLVMNPVVLGAGRPLFGGLDEKRNLRLAEAVSWPSGCVALTYQAADETPETYRIS
jgi:dihydrofolate reductase